MDSAETDFPEISDNGATMNFFRSVKRPFSAFKNASGKSLNFKGPSKTSYTSIHHRILRAKGVTRKQPYLDFKKRIKFLFY